VVALPVPSSNGVARGGPQGDTLHATSAHEAVRESRWTRQRCPGVCSWFIRFERFASQGARYDIGNAHSKKASAP